MSNKIFHWTSTFKSHVNEEDGSVEIKGLASTNAEDRAGDIIEAEAWTKGGLDNYLSNPIVLFNHDYNKPIGRAKTVSASKDGLEFTARISKAAGDIKELIKDGVLGAFSVGFRVKDAESLPNTGGLKVKDAELFEVSVVSIPCNQGATFALSKSFDSMDEYNKFKESFVQTNSVDSVKTEETEQSKAAEAIEEENRMSDVEKNTPEFDLDAFAKDVAEKAAAKLAMQQAEQKAAEEKAAKEAEEKAAQVEAEEKAIQEAKQEEQKTVIQAGLSGAEKLMQDVEKRFSDKNEELGSIVAELKSELAEKSEEIMKIRESKRVFSDRGQSSDWKKSFQEEIIDSKFLGLATGRGYDTGYAKSLMQKVNEHSGVQVSSADFEQVVSTNIERDIQNELVLAPLFREIQMNSANMIMPIMPDAGYAEFTGNQAASGSSPHGNLAERGDAYGAPFGGNDLTEKTLSTKKLISTSFIGNETEEDAIMPVLPLIRESMVRAHARGIENAILVGNHADGVYGTSGATFNGLVAKAVAGDGGSPATSYLTQSATAFASESLTAANLLAARKNMGKYGVNPADVVFIVNQQEYFNLLSDAEFQDANLVGDMATKLTGEIGSVYGSRVLLCDEFASPAISKFYGVAVYARNYVMPRLRGVTIESDYDVQNQRRVLVASQRLGFDSIIDNAKSVWGLQYKAS
jgi:HK97 family phage prohead protease/HK97 family phage major capsid protein